LLLLTTQYHAESVGDECFCHIWHRACQAACAAGGRAFIAEQRLTRIDSRAHVTAVHTEVLAGRDMEKNVSWGFGRPGIG